MKFNDMSKHITAHAIWEIIKFALGLILVTSSSFFTSELLVKWIDLLRDFKPYLIAIITSSGLLVFIYIYQNIRQYRPEFPSLEFDYKVLEKEITMELSSRNSMR